MKIHIETENYCPDTPLRVGNVYPVRGGRGLRDGNMMICIAITPPKPCVGSWALMLIINKDGDPLDVTRYGVHCFEDRAPIAFVEGVENIELFVRSI